MEPFKQDGECNSKNLDFFFFGILKINSDCKIAVLSRAQS